MRNLTEFETVAGGRIWLRLAPGTAVAGAAGIEMVAGEDSAQSCTELLDWIERLQSLPYFSAMPGF